MDFSHMKEGGGLALCCRKGVSKEEDGAVREGSGNFSVTRHIFSEIEQCLALSVNRLFCYPCYSLIFLHWCLTICLTEQIWQERSFSTKPPFSLWFLSVTKEGCCSPWKRGTKRGKCNKNGLLIFLSILYPLKPTIDCLISTKP